MKLFGSRNQRLLRRYDRLVSRAGELEAELEALSDSELREKKEAFRQRLAPARNPQRRALERELQLLLDSLQAR